VSRGIGSWLVAGVAALVVSLVGPVTTAVAKAAPNPKDTTAARRLIGELTRYDRSIIAGESRIRAAANREIAHVSAGCNGLLPVSLETMGNAQQKKVWTALILEATIDQGIADSRSLVATERRDARTLGRLHFSRGAVNRRVTRYVKVAKATLALKPTNLCAHVAAAAATRDVVIPAATRRFNAAFNRLASVDAADLITAVKPFVVRAVDKAAMRRAVKLDTQIENFELSFGVKALVKLASALNGKPVHVVPLIRARPPGPWATEPVAALRLRPER
jgi:hypothetical protein